MRRRCTTATQLALTTGVRHAVAWHQADDASEAKARPPPPRTHGGGGRPPLAEQGATIALGGGIVIAAPVVGHGRHHRRTPPPAHAPTTATSEDEVPSSSSGPNADLTDRNALDVGSSELPPLLPRERGTAPWLPDEAFLDKIRAANKDYRGVSAAIKGIELGLSALDEACAASCSTNTIACTTSDVVRLWSLVAAQASVPALRATRSKGLVHALTKRTMLLMDSFRAPDAAAVLVLSSRAGCASDSLLSRILVHMTRLEETAASGTAGSGTALGVAHALPLLCALGALQLPGHFQAHRLYHMYLPQLLAALPHVVSPTMLCELLLGMTRYSIGGAAVGLLTQQVAAHLADVPPALLVRMVSALRTIGRGRRGASGMSDRRASSRGSGLRLVAGGGRSLDGVEEEYTPLTAMLMEHGASLLAASTPHIDAATRRDRVAFLLDLYEVNTQLEYPSWATVYHVLCSSMQSHAAVHGGTQQLQALPQPEQHQVSKSSSTMPDRNAATPPLLPAMHTREVVRVVRAILKRNTSVPFHGVHAVLTQRLLADCCAAVAQGAISASPLFGTLDGRRPRTDGERVQAVTAAAGLACIATCLMAPPASDPSPSLTSVGSSFIATAVVSSPTAASEGPLVQQQALALLQAFGTTMSPTGFVSALCLAPIQTLTDASQLAAMVQHFSEVASSLNPSWLTRGVCALVDKIPTSVDILSFQRWMSKFAASASDDERTSFLRKLNVVDACNVLRRIAQMERIEHQERGGDGTTIALAKRSLVGHVTLKCATMELEHIPLVVGALQAADLLLPKAFARLCRALVPHVADGCLLDVLAAFSALADVYVTRRYRGSMFDDAWEMLRARCIRAAPSMLVAEAQAALNAFAKMDVDDMPLLRSLAHRWWWWSTTAAANDATTTKQLPLGKDSIAASACVPGFANEQCPVPDATKATGTSPSASHTDHALQLSARLRALTPEAHVVLLHTIASGAIGDDGGEQVAAVSLALPLMVMHLSSTLQQLYPQWVLLLTTTLHRVAPSISVEPRSDPECVASADLSAASRCFVLPPLALQQLHALLDDCRQMLLMLYGTTSEAVALRTDWHPRVQSSTKVHPSAFVKLLIAMASSGTSDPELFAALMESGVPLRWLASPRGIEAQELTLLTMGACAALSPSTSVEMNASSMKAVRKRVMAPLLDAVMARAESMEALDIRALRRCLVHYFGAGNIDAALTERLDAQLRAVDRQCEEVRKLHAGLNQRQGGQLLASVPSGSSAHGAPSERTIEAAAPETFFF